MVNQSLKYALNNYKIITIMYMKGVEITQTRIQVLRMDDGVIKALDIDKGQFRTFKVENILSAIDTKLIDNEGPRGGIIMLTEKQKNVLKAINSYINANGISPTVRNIGDLMGLNSSSTVHGHLSRLENEGYITKIDGSPRSITVTEKGKMVI